MMPIYPGAPWLPKLEGTEGREKYEEWKAQIKGLLSTQELSESKKVAIILHALSGDAKRQIMVVDDEERNTAAKIFTCLDSLYREEISLSKLRSQFYGCTQRPGESVSAYILRYRELACGLRRHDPDTAPSDAVLRDQLLMGLADGPMSQALRIYARRHPDADFTALRLEALSLNKEYGSMTSDVACHAINPSTANPPQASDWRKDLKKEIMDDVKTQIQGITEELLREIKPRLQPATEETRPRAPSPPEYRRAPPGNRYVPHQRNEWDETGRPICRQCRRAGHIARFCRSEQKSLNQ